MPLKPYHFAPDITAEQRCNLIKLARGLLFGGKERKSHFDMRRYCIIDACEPGTGKGHELTPADYNTCGTVACAAGHGPLYVAPKPAEESWVDYSSRVFVGYSTDRHAYHWCFAGGWSDTDNTPEGAAKRILYMLKFGVPDNGNLCSEEAVELYANLTLEELDPCTEEPSHVQA